MISNKYENVVFAHENTEGVVISRKSKDRRYNDQKKQTKCQIIYKTLHRKLKIEQSEPH
jgi:hypothetical protein